MLWIIPAILAAISLACAPERPPETSQLKAALGCDYSDGHPPGDAQARGWDVPDGPVAGPVLDCAGGTIESLAIKDPGTLVQNCTILGSVRILPRGIINANDVYPASRTREPGYVASIRSEAPTRVWLKDVTIRGTRRPDGKCLSPLYIGPGVTYTRLVRVQLEGCSDSSMVYLDAESSRTRFLDVQIDARSAERACVSVDASDHNEFIRFTCFHERGGLEFYRNCGEAGRTRVTTPSYNTGRSLVFRGGENDWRGRDPFPSLHFNTRQGNRCYCQDDAGASVGSSRSNMDHARGNVFENIDWGPGGWGEDGGSGNQF